MAKGYTLEELQAMGARPKAAQQKRGYTLEELQAMGARPSYMVPPEEDAPAALSQPPEEPPKQPEGRRGVLGAVADFGIGAAKGLGSTVAGASALGEKLLQAPLRAAGMEARKPLGQEVRESGVLTPKGTAQKAGFVTEQIAEFLLPGGAAAKGAKAVEAATGLAKAGKGLAGAGRALGRLGTRAGAEAAVAGGITAAQTAGDRREIGKAAAIGAASVPVLGVLGAVGRGVGFAGRQALGRTTGAGEAAIAEAFKNPNVIKYARRGAQGAAGLQEEALQGAVAGLKKMTKERGDEYVASLTKIKARPEKLREVWENAVIRAKEALDDASVAVTKRGVIPGKKGFKASAIEQGQGSVKKAYDTLRGWKDFSAAGLDNLKKKLTQFQNAVKNTTDGSYAAIKEMRSAVDDGLKTFVPGYRDMTARYAEASDLLDDIERSLSLKQTAATETSLNKLMGALRQNNELRLKFLEQLGGKSGKDVIGRLAGAQLAPLTPRGIAGGTFGLGGIGATALGNFPGLLVYLAATSPRLVAEAVSIAGRSGEKLASPAVQNALRALIIQATRSPENQAPSEAP